MIVTCGNCQSKFKLDQKLVKEGGTSVRCSRCKHVFKVFPKQPEPVEPDTNPLGEMEKGVDDFVVSSNDQEQSLPDPLAVSLPSAEVTNSEAIPFQDNHNSDPFVQTTEPPPGHPDIADPDDTLGDESVAAFSGLDDDEELFDDDDMQSSSVGTEVASSVGEPPVPETNFAPPVEKATSISDPASTMKAQQVKRRAMAQYKGDELNKGKGKKAGNRGMSRALFASGGSSSWAQHIVWALVLTVTVVTAFYLKGVQLWVPNDLEVFFRTGYASRAKGVAIVEERGFWLSRTRANPYYVIEGSVFNNSDKSMAAPSFFATLSFGNNENDLEQTPECCLYVEINRLRLVEDEIEEAELYEKHLDKGELAPHSVKKFMILFSPKGQPVNHRLVLQE